jgi:hypothetical protein
MTNKESRIENDDKEALLKMITKSKARRIVIKPEREDT